MSLEPASYLLKLATMMGMGRVMHSTPQIAHSDATNLPAGVLPAQNIVIVCVCEPQPISRYLIRCGVSIITII